MHLISSASGCLAIAELFNWISNAQLTTVVQMKKVQNASRLYKMPAKELKMLQAEL